MTEERKLAMLSAITGESDATVLFTYLELAKGIVLRKAFPYGDGSETMPDKYDTTHVEIASYMLQKRGAEGETYHTENGIARSYENADIPYTLLRRITPMAGVMSK